MTDGLSVFWPASGDQGHTSNALTHTHQVGIELLQVRNGYNIGRTTALGTKVEGTVEAMRREFAEVFGGIMGVDGASGGGALGKRLREGVERLAVEVGQDEAEGGGTWKAMRRLAAM